MSRRPRPARAGWGPSRLAAIVLVLASTGTAGPLASQTAAEGYAGVERQRLLLLEAARQEREIDRRHGSLVGASIAGPIPRMPSRGSRPLPAHSADGDGTHAAWLSLGGLAAAGAGILGGFVAGAAQSCRGETSRDAGGTCALAGGFWGAAVGTTVAVPLTVHLLNGRRGSWLAAQAVSAGAFGLGIAVAAAAEDISSPGTAIVLVSIPLGQIAGSIAVEKGTAHRRP